MAKRINVMLPEATIRMMDRLSRPGERSRLIDRAVQYYAATASAEALQERLKQAALRDRDLDLKVSGDWCAIDKEQWQRTNKPEKRQAAAGRNAAKSTSRRSIR